MTQSAELIELLNLTPGTCGYMAQSFESPLRTPEGTAAVRSIGAALYFLVTPERGVRPHRIRSDQIYHHYVGDPLEVLLLHADGAVTQAVVGSDFSAGGLPQLLIPASTFHVARLRGSVGWALLGTTSWPAVGPGEFESASRESLQRDYPAAADAIASYLPE